MLTLRKAITCLIKKSFETTVVAWHLFKDLGLKLEFEKGEAKAWELYQTLCEFVREIGWDFLCVFVLCCCGRGSYWIFLAFVLVPSSCCVHCCRRFLVLSHFAFVNRFLFYRRTVVVRSC